MRKHEETVARVQHHLAVVLGSATDLNTALGQVLEAVCQIQGADCGGVYLVDPRSGALHLSAHRGLSQEFVALVSYCPADSPAGRPVQCGEPVHRLLSAFHAVPQPVLDRESLRALVLAPILHDGRPLGVLYLASRNLKEMPPSSRSAVEVIAVQIGGMLARINAQNSLAQRNLHPVFNSICDFLFIFDTEGHLLLASPAGWAKLGYSQAELAGMAVFDLHPPELRDQVATKVADILAGRTDVCELPLLRKDGNLVAVETKFSRGEWDNRDVVFAISRDVTERKRFEEALRESEERLSLVVWATNDAVWDCNLATGAVWWNDAYAALFGVWPRDVQAFWQWWMDHIHPADRNRVVEMLRATLDSQECHCVAEYRFQRRDGTWATVIDRAYVARGADGKPHRILGAMQDITDQKVGEERRQLLQLQLAHMGRLSTMGELVAGIAHEVNQPLYSIVNYAKACRNLLAQGNPDLGELSEWTREIAAEAVRAGEIIKRLRDFLSRPEAKRLPVRVNEVVEESMALVAFEIRRLQLAVERVLADADPVADMDRIEIQQVLVNLLRNACEAVEENAVGSRFLTIRTTLTGDFVEVSIADNGPGLPRLEGGSVFEPFVTTKPHGLGMGLAISRTIVEAHGGQIWATANPIAGATFQFTLPVKKSG